MITGIELISGVLRERFDVPVVHKVPESRPEAFVRVDQTTPVVLSPVHQRVRVIVQIYGDDDKEVIRRAFDIREMLEYIERYAPGKALAAEEVTGPEEFPDPDLPRVYRWQVSAVVYMVSC